MIWERQAAPGLQDGVMYQRVTSGSRHEGDAFLAPFQRIDQEVGAPSRLRRGRS
jgi:hypothetical protein